MANTFNLYQDPTTQEWGGPKRRQVGRLFNYLGIQDPGDKRAFRMGARGGTLGQYFADRPTSYELFNKLVTDPGTQYQGRKARRFNRLQDAAQMIGYLGGYNKPATPTTTSIDSKPPNTPAAPGTAPGPSAAPTVPQTIEDMLKKLGGYMGPTGQGISSQISGLLSGTNGNLAPGFQNMFQNLLNLHQQNADRNAAALTEAMGSRGARYGSDILNAQGDMRRLATNELNAAGDQLALQLMGNQQGLLGLGQQSAQMEQAARENAMSRMFQEYLTQTQLPPIFQSMIGALSGLPQRDTLSYIG